MWQSTSNPGHRHCSILVGCLVLMTGCVPSTLGNASRVPAEPCGPVSSDQIRVSVDAQNGKTIGVLGAVPLAPGISVSVLVVAENSHGEAPHSIALILRETHRPVQSDIVEHVAFRIDDRVEQVGGRLYPLGQEHDGWSARTAMVSPMLWDEVAAGRSVFLIASGREYFFCERLIKTIRELVDRVRFTDVSKPSNAG